MNTLSRLGLNLKIIFTAPQYRAEPPYDCQHRRTGFMGWFSHFVGLKAPLIAYMRDAGIVYRVLDKDNHGTLGFWRHSDYEKFRESMALDWFLGRHELAREFDDLGIYYVSSDDLFYKNFLRYRVFSPTSMVEIMLRYQTKREPRDGRHARLIVY